MKCMVSTPKGDGRCHMWRFLYSLLCNTEGHTPRALLLNNTPPDAPPSVHVGKALQPAPPDALRLRRRLAAAARRLFPGRRLSRHLAVGHGARARPVCNAGLCAQQAML